MLNLTVIAATLLHFLHHWASIVGYAFGISIAPKGFQRRMDDTLNGPPGIRLINDDILI